MSATSSPRHPLRTIGDLLRGLGDIPADRVRFVPSPGSATIADVAANRLCELVDGTLVEKPVGWTESLLAIALGGFLRDYLKAHRLGVVTGPDSTQAIQPDLVRIPDVSFFSWDRLPGRRIPSEPVPAIVPDLAIEILSASNTAAEMARKRKEYFDAGVREIWMINPVARTAEVFSPAGASVLLRESDRLTSEDILPGFVVELRELFGELDSVG